MDKTIKLNTRIGVYTTAVLAIVTVLAGLLTYFESTSGQASITSFPKALWYSLVVMTTRGYGDLFPVTVYGRMIGMVFILLSTVCYCLVIAYFISLAINFRRKLKPGQR